MEAPIPYGAKETMLAMDFDLMAQNRASRTTATLGESLRGKGWNELRRISPQFSGNYTCQGTQETLSSMVQGDWTNDRHSEGYPDGTHSSVDAVGRRGQHHLAIQ